MTLYGTEAMMYLKAAKHNLQIAETKLAAMGDTDGWGDSSTKIEVGILRDQLKRADMYPVELDQVREFDICRIVFGGWSPRKEQEDQVRIEKSRIASYQKVLDTLLENALRESESDPWVYELVRTGTKKVESIPSKTANDLSNSIDYSGKCLVL